MINHELFYNDFPSLVDINALHRWFVDAHTLQGVPCAVVYLIGLNRLNGSNNTLERINIIGQIISQMRRLVISHILPCHTHAVYMVVHQGGHTVIGGGNSGIDIQSVVSIVTVSFFRL